MESLPKEPKGFFDGFTLWDWFIIWVTSDLGSTGLVLFFTGGNGFWYLVLAWGLWWLHIYNLEEAIKRGER
jgi:hypothetical protein